jgi:hypothetical protein
MDFLISLSPIVSILSIFFLYVIRSEQEIKNLKLKNELLEKINYNEIKTLEFESNLSKQIAENNIRLLNNSASIEEIKTDVREIYNLIKEEKKHG